MDKEKYENYKGVIESYVYEETGIELIIEETSLSENSYYHPDTITINSYQNYMSRFHTLLHEVGHVIDYHSNSELFPVPLTEDRKTISRKIDTLCREVIAWQQGYEIAVYLQFDIDVKMYLKTARKCIREYADQLYK